ncbi:hypothetical protein H0O01_00270 [Candidatus Micrarchaeota archaeon]|nr:hypothetical protein [Candidatus Micrarchaeota archaeon]
MSIFTDILQIKKPDKDLLESLLASYESLAKARGFEVKREGKTLFFKGERISAILRIEFGGRKDFFDTITYMNANPAEYKVLVVSSNARALPMEAAYTVLKKKLLVKERWMIIDIEGNKQPMYINWGPSQENARVPPVPPSRHPAAGNQQSEPEAESRPEAGPSVEVQPLERDPYREYAERAQRRESRRGKQVKRERKKMIYGAPDERKEQD